MTNYNSFFKQTSQKNPFLEQISHIDRPTDCNLESRTKINDTKDFKCQLLSGRMPLCMYFSYPETCIHK